MNTNIAQSPAGRQRRRHSPEFRASVIQACLQPGVSIAAVALANGLNANMVRKWVIEERERSLRAQDHLSRPVADRGSPPAPAFVPLALSAPSATSGAIQIELRRGEATVSVSWPVSAAGECAAWLREWLR